MPDITKCSGEGCSQKNTCYRFTSPSSEHRQSFFSVVPIKSDGSCDHLMPKKDLVSVFDQCPHVGIDTGIKFDAKAAKGLTPTEVRARWPRGHNLTCSVCGEIISAVYASYEHYIAGDW